MVCRYACCRYTHSGVPGVRSHTRCFAHRFHGQVCGGHSPSILFVALPGDCGAIERFRMNGNKGG